MKQIVRTLKVFFKLAHLISKLHIISRSIKTVSLNQLKVVLYKRLPAGKCRGMERPFCALRPPPSPPPWALYFRRVVGGWWKKSLTPGSGRQASPIRRQSQACGAAGDLVMSEGVSLDPVSSSTLAPCLCGSESEREPSYRIIDSWFSWMSLVALVRVLIQTYQLWG